MQTTNVFSRVLSVVRFELRRAMTFSRIAVWVVMVLFPPAIVMLLLMGDEYHPRSQVPLGLVLMMLIPQVTCLLGLLLWASPVIYSELEGKTWTYLAVRPGGRTVMLFGKYSSAVLWSVLAASLALLLVEPTLIRTQAVDEPGRLWGILQLLIVLAGLSYGALFILLGVMFHRRAMVICVAFTFIWEFSVSFIPAVIQQLTFAYHFRSLLIAWMNWTVPPQFSSLVGYHPVWYHFAMVLGLAITMLVVADVIVHQREYLTAEES